MQIANEFTIAADPGRTYASLLDLERVARCLPGAEIGGPAADASYPATVTVKLGPMRLVYAGSVRIAERDDEARRAVLVATGRETRGQGAAEATMTMSVSGDGGGARVSVLTDLRLSGRAAQMGRGVVEDVARRLMGETAACLEARLSPLGEDQADETGVERSAAVPVRVFSLVFASLADRAKRLVKR